jgi:hypothetical protein
MNHGMEINHEFPGKNHRKVFVFIPSIAPTSIFYGWTWRPGRLPSQVLLGAITQLGGMSCTVSSPIGGHIWGNPHWSFLESIPGRCSLMCHQPHTGASRSLVTRWWQTQSLPTSLFLTLVSCFSFKRKTVRNQRAVHVRHLNISVGKYTSMNIKIKGCVLS